MSVDRVWSDIEAWLDANAPKAKAVLRPPASASDVARVERLVGAPLPSDLRALLALHDGQRIPPFVSTVAGFMLLPCADVARTWTEYGELVDAGDLRRAAKSKSGTVKPVWWSKRWVPFAEGAGGDLLCIDLDPDAKGTSGQVLRFWHDEEWRDQMAPGLESFLDRFLADLRAGKYRVGKSGGIELA